MRKWSCGYVDYPAHTAPRQGRVNLELTESETQYFSSSRAASLITLSLYLSSSLLSNFLKVSAYLHKETQCGCKAKVPEKKIYLQATFDAFRLCSRCECALAFVCGQLWGSTKSVKSQVSSFLLSYLLHVPYGGTDASSSLRNLATLSPHIKAVAAHLSSYRLLTGV